MRGVLKVQPTGASQRIFPRNDRRALFKQLSCARRVGKLLAFGNRRNGSLSPAPTVWAFTSVWPSSAWIDLPEWPNFGILPYRSVRKKVVPRCMDSYGAD